MSKQYFKALYFNDYQDNENGDKSFTIAFSEKEYDTFQKVSQLSSYEVQKLIGFYSYVDLKDLASKEERSVNQYIKRLIVRKIEKTEHKKYKTKDVTFGNSKNIPFQRWYPYIEGYSPIFVQTLIDQYCEDPSLIYEPFAGTGTTIFASDLKGINTIYSEVNPLLRFLIKVKTDIMVLDSEYRIQLSEELSLIADSILEVVNECKSAKYLENSYIRVFGKSIYFPKDQFETILKIRSFIDSEYKKGNNIIADLLSVAVFACLLPVSYLKKQGDVRFKTEKEKQTEMKKISDILPNKIKEISEDVSNLSYSLSKNHRMVTENAKMIGKTNLDEKISSVITSPPYLNGTNYFRNTKIELWFLQYLKNEKDLRVFRDEALTSGINDVKTEYSKYEDNIQSHLLNETMKLLQENAYDKRIPLMAKCYFREMHQLFNGLKIHLKSGATIMIDLGDSIFSGVHIKTDLILVEILETLGYSFQEKCILRQRRSRNGELLSQVLLVLKYKSEK